MAVHLWSIITLENLDASYTTNRNRLSVPTVCLCHAILSIVPCDKHEHTAHAHQQAASQASTDSARRHHVWLPHSSLGFQRPAGRRSYRLTPQATIAHRIVLIILHIWKREWMPSASKLFTYYFTCDVNMPSLSWHWRAATASAACVARLGAVVHWCRSWPMANKFVCLCSCHWSVDILNVGLPCDCQFVFSVLDELCFTPRLMQWVIFLECITWNSLPNAVFAASSAKNFKMNLCKVNFDRFLTIVEWFYYLYV